MTPSLPSKRQPVFACRFVPVLFAALVFGGCASVPKYSSVTFNCGEKGRLVLNEPESTVSVELTEGNFQTLQAILTQELLLVEVPHPIGTRSLSLDRKTLKLTHQLRSEVPNNTFTPEVVQCEVD